MSRYLGSVNGHEPATVTVPWLLGRGAGEQTDGGDPRTRALSDPEIAAVLGVCLATVVLGVIGLVNSFRAVAAAAEPSFGALAWTVPLAIDVGILVFSALDLVLARLDLRIRWLRLVPWSLVGITIYLNVAAETTWFGRLAHAALPAMWVIAVEVATHAVRTRAGLASRQRMERIRGSRWLLAPFSTAGLWRRMVLWEIRSYPEALNRERRRLLALTHLQDRYGRLAWRWKAPRRERALYRLGELAPDHTPAMATGHADGDEAATSTDTASDTGTDGGHEGRTPRRTHARTGRAGRPDTAAEVARLRQAHPDMPAGVIADRLGVSDRTVRRHLAAMTTSTHTTQSTGTQSTGAATAADRKEADR